MMKHGAYLQVTPYKLLIVITGLSIVFLLGSCASNKATRPIRPERYRLRLQTGHNGNWRCDTLFSTPADSVLFSGPVPQRRSVFRSQDDVELDYAIDFGDGTFTDDPVIDRSMFAHKHLYARKGTYMARVWGEYEDSMYCADTVYVQVQDYVWPKEATRINVSITGIALHVFHVIERPGKRDSTYMTVEKDYTGSIAEDTNRVFHWDPFRGLHFSECLERKPNGFCDVVNSGDCTFLADGRMIHNLNLHIPVADTLMRERQDNYAYIKVGRLSLKPGTNPTAAHAVYEKTYNRTEFERRYSSYEKAAGYRYSIHEDSHTHRASTIHTSPYSDVTITVEFTQ